MGQQYKLVEREGRTDRNVNAFVLTDDGQGIPVVITNVSNRGCLIKAAGDLTVGEQVRLEVPRLGGMWAHVRWIAGGNAGVEFVPDSDLWEQSDAEPQSTASASEGRDGAPGPCNLPNRLAEPRQQYFASHPVGGELMSIRKMIALHPGSKEHVNQALGDAVHHLMYCAKMCLSCADACMAEADDMTQCIRLCLDCSDICEVTSRLGLRRTGDDQPMLRELLELCARMCDQCAAECERHEHEHCKLCAQICRECANDCSNAAASIA